MSFSDKLTPGQVRLVLDNLELPWREYYNPANDGWVNIPSYAIQGFDWLYSDLSVNVFHGGFVDQYRHGSGSTYDNAIQFKASKGDIVILVRCVIDCSAEHAIKYIKGACGINKGVKPPDMPEGGSFANEWLDDHSYTRIPEDIWQSDLSTSAKLIWIAIFSRINKGEIYSFAGVRNISKQTGISNPTIQKAIKELESAGLLMQKPSRIGQKMNRYPTVVKKQLINENLNTENETVQETYTVCIKNLYGGVQNSYTELDPMNKTHLNKTQIATRANQEFAPTFFSEMFMYLQKEYAEIYNQLKTKNDLSLVTKQVQL